MRHHWIRQKEEFCFQQLVEKVSTDLKDTPTTILQINCLHRNPIYPRPQLNQDRHSFYLKVQSIELETTTAHYQTLENFKRKNYRFLRVKGRVTLRLGEKMPELEGSKSPRKFNSPFKIQIPRLKHQIGQTLIVVFVNKFVDELLILQQVLAEIQTKWPLRVVAVTPASELTQLARDIRTLNLVQSLVYQPQYKTNKGSDYVPYSVCYLFSGQTVVVGHSGIICYSSRQPVTQKGFWMRLIEKVLLEPQPKAQQRVRSTLQQKFNEIPWVHTSQQMWEAYLDRISKYCSDAATTEKISFFTQKASFYSNNRVWHKVQPLSVERFDNCRLQYLKDLFADLPRDSYYITDVATLRKINMQNFQKLLRSFQLKGQAFIRTQFEFNALNQVWLRFQEERCEAMVQIRNREDVRRAVDVRKSIEVLKTNQPGPYRLCRPPYFRLIGTRFPGISGLVDNKNQPVCIEVQPGRMFGLVIRKYLQLDKVVKKMKKRLATVGRLGTITMYLIYPLRQLNSHLCKLLAEIPNTVVCFGDFENNPDIQFWNMYYQLNTCLLVDRQGVMRGNFDLDELDKHIKFICNSDIPNSSKRISDFRQLSQLQKLPTLKETFSLSDYQLSFFSNITLDQQQPFFTSGYLRVKLRLQDKPFLLPLYQQLGDSTTIFQETIQRVLLPSGDNELCLDCGEYVGTSYCYLLESKIFFCLRCLSQVQTHDYSKDAKIKLPQTAVILHGIDSLYEFSFDNSKSNTNCGSCRRSVMEFYKCPKCWRFICTDCYERQVRNISHFSCFKNKHVLIRYADSISVLNARRQADSISVFDTRRYAYGIRVFGPRMSHICQIAPLFI